MDLNYPLLRAPFEQTNKVFRLYHKQLTRELGQIAASIEALDEEQHPAHRMDVDAAITKLSGIEEAVMALKSDAKIKAAAQEASLEACVKRAGYMTELDASFQMLKGPDAKSTTAAQHENYVNDRLIVDYLLSRGLFKSSKLILDAKEIGYLVDDVLYKECHALVLDLESRNTSTTIAWCSQNGSRLRRLQSPLEFRLRLQEVVELIRCNKRLEAIQYAQAHLTPLAMHQENQELKQAAVLDVQAVMTTLAFESPEKCGIEAYEKLFAPERWTGLVDLLRKTFFEVYGMHTPPSLSIALHAGLSSLNTRACHRVRDAHLKQKLVRRRSELEATGNDCDARSDEEKSESAKKAKLGAESSSGPAEKVYLGDFRAEKVRVSSPVPVCPACSDVGSQLCRGLPFAYHPHSRLVCRVTHSVMDENNPPVVLPNGRVYSRQGIDALTQRSQDGTIQCVDTQEAFAPADAKPVYIL